MKKEMIKTTEERYLVGLSVRTNNQECFDPSTNKISPLIARYYQEKIAEKISHRKNPGVALAMYTDYATDEHGDYTYFFGEEVLSLDNCPSELSYCVIPAGNFVKFTTPEGKMPDVVIQAWMDIWKMTPNALGGKRAYLTDFEIYDERAYDPNATSVDIYIRILT